MKFDPAKHSGLKPVLMAYSRAAAKYPRLLGGVLAGSLALQTADLIAPLYLRQFFNTLATATPSAAAVRALSESLLLVGLMWLIGWAAQRAQSFCNEELESRVMQHLYKNSFGYLLRHSHNFFISNFAGSLSHKVNRFARSFETIFDSVMQQFFPTLVFVLGAIVVLFIRNTVLGGLLALCTAVLLGGQVYLSRVRYGVRAGRTDAEEKLTGALSDAISNQHTITLFATAAREEHAFSSIVDVWRKATLRSWKSDSWVWAGLNFFTILIEVAILWASIFYWQKGLLTVGDFVLIQAYLLSTFNRLTGINFVLRRFYDAYADAGKMISILELPHEIQDQPDAPNLRVSLGNIEFKDVNFRFASGASVLSHFSATIRGGEKVALVGPSGAGKSTLTKLLLRLFDVENGSIEIDGQNIARVTQESLRSQIAFVPQEPILFHRTLKENIRYAKPDASDEELFEAARKAHCHEFIERFKDGYGTYVGERGVRLSGGERQRVAIARAILKDAPILVLDEATSSLDSQSEMLIQDALANLMRGKTVIVVAHRLSTIMKMDRILVIEGGVIVDQDRHEALLEKGGLYATLWNIQAGGFLPADDQPDDGQSQEREPETPDEEEKKFTDEANDKLSGENPENTAAQEKALRS